ncbi:glutathione S-transferase family protein [Ottowia sp.]|jgi:glutathione S-transferase|uniref:glutathione S-transferase family protein n=1 Tax=Ottowia sp. TaxID=1898956 RepID=UPI0025D3D53C|nr:glutathione S-transferase [Ottowia sp.]MBK6615385.1 glutathione S-transferase family protein [Ottowia sp.]MBK6746456.1 glutathione S-transferase family protein [Ottowia sp.]
MIRLWGRISSINVRKAVWALQEVGVPFERIDAGRQYGIVDTPGYGARNPNRLVPLLEDDGFELWESNAIVRYLCAKYGAPTLPAARGSLPPEGAGLAWGGPARRPASPDALYPRDLRRRFDAERWMDWQQTTLNRAGSPAFVQWIRTPFAQRRPDVIEASRSAMAPLIAILDAHLAGREWMGGEDFSMADIPVACDIHRWWRLPQPAPQAPHVQRWLDAILARPATRGVLDLPLA